MTTDGLFPSRHDLVIELRDETAEIARSGGGSCPVCDQHVQVYRRSINRGMVVALLLMYRHAGTTPAHKPTVLSGVGANARDESLLRFWNLMVEEPDVRGDGGRAGWWRVTDRGVAFLLGDLSVPKYAITYAGRFVRFDGDLVDVSDAWAAPFHLGALLHVSAGDL